MEVIDGDMMAAQVLSQAAGGREGGQGAGLSELSPLLFQQLLLQRRRWNSTAGKSEITWRRKRGQGS